MKKMISTVILASLLAAPVWPLECEGPVPGQAVDASSRAARISRDLAFRDIRLDLRDGTTVRGRLNGATGDSIRIRQGGEDRDYAFKGIRRVLIRSEALRSKGAVPGLAFGLYVGNSALLLEGDTPGFYLRRFHIREAMSLWLLLGEGFFAAMGGGAGWLAGSGGSRNGFEFPSDPEAARGAEERFIRFLAGETAPGRVHLLIQNGFLLPGASRRFEALAEQSGFTLNYHNTYLTKFSALRGLELSVSIGPRIRAGLRVSFPSEPNYDSYRSGETEGTWTWAWQELRATAFHGIGAVDLSRPKRLRGLSLSFGLGAGAASVRLVRDATTYVASPEPLGGYEIVGKAEVRKTLPSAVAFGAVQYPLTAVLSIGLAADFTFIPAVTVDALTDNGLPGQKLGLGNGSVGFVLGYHF